MATVRPCSLSVDEYLAAGRRERSAWVHRGFISGTIWTMSKIRLRSAEAPFDHRRVVGEAARPLCRAEASGIWDPPALVTRLDGQLFGSALDDIAECGVATTRRLEWSTYAEKGSDDFADWIHGVRSELEDCPVPQRELPKLVDALGSDLRDRLGVSPSALQRYRDESRDTPDDVAWRAHVLAEIVGDLAGSYNDRGIRGWFKRPRPQLEGRTPAGILSGKWDPQSADVAAVRKLAGSLVG